MLAIKNQQLKLNKVNTRMERHGESLVPAIDLSLTMQGGNKLLDMIHADLRVAHYTAKAKGNGEKPQGELELPVEDMPNLRFPKHVYPVKFDVGWSGYTMRIDYGRGGNADLVLRMCEIKSIDVTPIDGGSCELSFKVQTNADVDEKLCGKLDLLQQNNITADLTPPKVAPGQQTLDDAAERAQAASAQADAVIGKAKAGAKGKAKPASDAEKAEAATQAFVDSAKDAKEEPPAAKKAPAKKGKTPLAKKVARAAKKAPGKKASK